MSFGPLGQRADDAPPSAADLALPPGQESYDPPARERALAAYSDERALPEAWGESSAYAAVRRAYATLDGPSDVPGLDQYLEAASDRLNCRHLSAQEREHVQSCNEALANALFENARSARAQAAEAYEELRQAIESLELAKEQFKAGGAIFKRLLFEGKGFKDRLGQAAARLRSGGGGARDLVEAIRQREPEFLQSLAVGRQAEPYLNQAESAVERAASAAGRLDKLAARAQALERHANELLAARLEEERDAVASPPLVGQRRQSHSPVWNSMRFIRNSRKALAEAAERTKPVIARWRQMMETDSPESVQKGMEEDRLFLEAKRAVIEAEGNPAQAQQAAAQADRAAPAWDRTLSAALKTRAAFKEGEALLGMRQDLPQPSGDLPGAPPPAARDTTLGGEPARPPGGYPEDVLGTGAPRERKRVNTNLMRQRLRDIRFDNAR